MRTSMVLYFLGSIFLVISFQNCSAVHESNATLSSFEACNLILKDEFSRGGYKAFLETNCKNCHVSNGTGNGAFADGNIDISFDSFIVRGNQLVGDRAKDPNHQPPYTGSQHEEEINQLDETWNAAKTQVDICVANAGIQIDTIQEGIVPEDPQPTQGTVTTFIKLLEASKDSKTLTWDLGSEIKSPSGLSFPGAELSIEVTALTTVTGEKSYVFSNPKLTAGDQALHLMLIEFVINNQLVSAATSFHNINRRVPANQTRDLAVSSIVFGYNIRSTDTVSLSIGVLDPVDFAPPTFEDLIAPDGIFQVHCMSCHNGSEGQSPQGGFDISSRDSVIRNLMVAPFSPNNSEIFKRMNDTDAPMPQNTGLRPQTEINQILWWIQDGAP